MGDFPLFPELKQIHGGHNSKDDHEVGKVTHCLVTQDADWYEQEIGKLIFLYNKYPTRGGDYLEKYWDSITIKGAVLQLISTVLVCGENNGPQKYICVVNSFSGGSCVQYTCFMFVLSSSLTYLLLSPSSRLSL